MRWKDLDFESRTISINHNLMHRVYRQQGEKCEMHITTPKTSAGCRTVPMLDEVRRALLQEKRQQMQRRYNEIAIDGYSGFIFTNREGYVHNPQTINRAIKRIYTAYNEREKEMAKQEHREPFRDVGAVLTPVFMRVGGENLRPIYDQ